MEAGRPVTQSDPSAEQLDRYWIALSFGAVGVISVAAHWAGEQIRAIFDAFDAGDVSEAMRINQTLLASYAFESTLDAPNPVPTKAMLRTLGLPAGECRPPMGPTPDVLEVQAKELWDSLAS